MKWFPRRCYCERWSQQHNYYIYAVQEKAVITGSNGVTIAGIEREIT